MSQQLALPFEFDDQRSFENFIPGDNVQLIHTLQSLDLAKGWESIYLAGPRGTGKTHCLHACCAHFLEAGWRVCYFDFLEIQTADPQILQGLEQYNLVVLDNCQAIAGLAAWEEALFGCYHDLQEAGRTLCVSATERPAAVGFSLPDLVSRLQAAVIFWLKPLSDHEKIQVLQQRAAAHGLDLPEAVGNYLLHHYQRDLSKLLQHLATLDEASLSNQRRLTIPFIRSVLSS